MAQSPVAAVKTPYPIVMTRDFKTAKNWLRTKMRGTERIGVTASSNAFRLMPEGVVIDITHFDAANWFLNPKDDVRSSYFLEIPATEFGIQGLELDWVCVGWDLDFYYKESEEESEEDGWNYRTFSGTKWRRTKNQMYIKNSYRVLLTRARQGMIIFVPKGDSNDKTRPPEKYDGIYNYLKKIGIEDVESI